jgi:hypothetical protein
MKRGTPKTLEEELLEPVPFTGRVEPAGFLFISRSRKPWTRRHIEGKPLFHLAMQLEFDANVSRYNVRVPPQPLALDGSAAAELHAPAAVSESPSGDMTLHVFASNADLDGSLLGPSRSDAERAVAIGERQYEIERWIADSGAPMRPWVAIDDDATLFRPGCPNLVVCDPAIGLTVSQLDELDVMLMSSEMRAGKTRRRP